MEKAVWLLSFRDKALAVQELFPRFCQPLSASEPDRVPRNSRELKGVTEIFLQLAQFCSTGQCQGKSLGMIEMQCVSLMERGPGQCDGTVKVTSRRKSRHPGARSLTCCQVLNLNSHEGYSYSDVFQQYFSGNNLSIPPVPRLKGWGKWGSGCPLSK